LLALVSVLIAASHPSLFFSSADVPALRAAANTTHAPIASHITAILNQHLGDPTPSAAQYDDFRFLGNQVAVWAFGYQLTGDARYAAIARSQLLTYAGWPDWDNGEIVDLGGPDLNTAHMLLGVACAYDWIYDTLTAADRTTIAAKLGVEAQKVAAYMPSAWWVDQYLQNHNWIDTAGLGMAALALQGEDARAAGWLSLAQGNLAKLQQSIGQIPDGSWHEGLPYEGYGLAMAMPFWSAMRHAGADYTDMGLLRGYGKFYLSVGIPDSARQLILPFGDFTHWPAQQVLQILRFTAARFRDGYAETAAQRYLAAIGTRGNFLPELWYDVFEFLNYDPTVAKTDVHTLPLDQSFPDIGAAVLHSSWDPGDFVLGFKAGVYGGRVNFNRVRDGVAPGGWVEWGHDHNDDMSFWLYGKGAWLAPEAMGYDAGANGGYALAKRANYTNFHNALLVDDNGQLGDVRASDSNWNNPWFWSRQSSPLFNPTGTADYAIAGGQGAQLFAASLGVSRWDRVLVMARGRYVLVRDDVEAAAAHAYDWICHFQDGVFVDTASGWVQGIGKSGQSLGVRVLSPPSWTATTGTQTAELMDQFDPDATTSYVRVRPAANAAAQQFLTALVPVATASWAARTPVDALSSADPGAGAVVAPASALEERWIFARSGVGKSAGDLVLTGSVAGMAGRSASGAPVRAVLFGAGTLSDQSGARLLLSTATGKAIQANLAGGTLVVTGDSIADFHAFAPTATQVTLNGIAVGATFESGMVTYPASVPCCGTPDAGVDAGPAPDAGVDAGPAPDAGVDAGPPPEVDAGCGNCQPPPDAGSDAGTDLPDAGTPDAGGPDSGNGGEPDPGTDAGAPADGGAGDETVFFGPGCSSSGSSTWLVTLGVAALLFRRRRR
jgi:MYXO-CTERM domain-containing protein